MLQADFFHPLFQVQFLRGASTSSSPWFSTWPASLPWSCSVGLSHPPFPGQTRRAGDHRDDYLMHILLFAILITGFLIEGARMAATELKQNPDLARFSPVGLLVARLLAGLDDRPCGSCTRSLVGPFRPRHGLHRRHSLHQVAPPLHHPANYLFADARTEGDHRHHRPGGRGGRAVRRGQGRRPDLERYLRRRRLHQLQTMPGPLPGLGHRKAPLPHEGGAADWGSGLCQPSGEPDRDRNDRCPLVMHHLPGLPGDLPGRHRACQQDPGDEAEPGPDGGRVPR